jgi:hypothetical protein
MPANRETRKPVPSGRVGVSRDAGVWRVVPVVVPLGLTRTPTPPRPAKTSTRPASTTQEENPPSTPSVRGCGGLVFLWVLAYMGRGKVNELGVCVSMSLLICHCISQVRLVGVRVLASPPYPPLRGGATQTLVCPLWVLTWFVSWWPSSWKMAGCGLAVRRCVVCCFVWRGGQATRMPL